MITEKLILSFIENNALDDLSEFTCPECPDMNEEYCCTLCWSNGKISFTQIVKALLSEKFNYKYSYDFQLNDILEYNEDLHNYETISIFDSTYKYLIDPNLFNEENSFMLEIEAWKIISFLKKGK